MDVQQLANNSCRIAVETQAKAAKTCGMLQTYYPKGIHDCTTRFDRNSYRTLFEKCERQRERAAINVDRCLLLTNMDNNKQ